MAAQGAGLVSLWRMLRRHFITEESLGTRMNPETIGCLWTGEFDQNTPTCGRGNFSIRKEKVADLKVSGYEWTGP